MKIRTDFVTNSSSSSFIFKEYDKKEIEKALQRRLSIPPRDKWEEREYEWIREVGKGIVGKRFCEYGLRELFEVYSWYQEEVLSKLFGIETYEDISKYDEWEENLSNVIKKTIYTEELLKRLTVKFILDLYANDYWRNYSWDSKEQEKMKIVSLAFLNEEIWEYMSSWNAGERLFIDFYADHLEKLLECAAEFEGKSIGEVMEFWFDAKYLYFNDFETHYMICEALKAAGICLHSCGHMG